LAAALISTAELIVGNLPRTEGLSIWPREKSEIIKERIQGKVAQLDDGDGVMILTDLLGGTPTNLSLITSMREKVEVLTGVNMPMLLAIFSYRKGKSLEEISKVVKKSGRRSIVLAKGVARLR
jgi:PTS system mannose-specific IIA component